MTTRTRTADGMALIALVLAAAAAAAGLLLPDLYRDTADGIRQARATDLATLLVAVPCLAIALWRARRGSAGGRLVAIGVLGYLAYSYAIYAFSVVINPLTPLHIATLGLATWALTLSTFGLADATIEAASRFRLPARLAGWFLIGVAVLFAMLWLSQIVGAIMAGRLPAAVSDLGLPTSPVYSLDLAFAVPLMTLSGIWLVRGDRRGRAAATAGLAFLTVLGLSVLAIFAFESAAGIAVAVVPIVLFGVVTAAAAALVGFGLTGSSASLGCRRRRRVSRSMASSWVRWRIPRPGDGCRPHTEGEGSTVSPRVAEGRKRAWYIAPAQAGRGLRQAG